LKLSIIIPIYNAEKYLNECLTSIKNSSSIYEVILVNDGSTDSSRKICEIVCKEDKRFKLFNNDNHGVSYSRNFGIEKAIGDYIMFVDADDVLKGEWENIVYDNFYKEDIVYINNQIKQSETKRELLKYILGFNKPCLAGPCSKLYKRIFLLENNIKFNKDIINGEDMLFNVESLIRAKNYKIINACFYLYRQINTSSTKTFNSNIFKSDVEFHKNLSELLKNENYAEKEQLMIFCKYNAVITFINKLVTLNSYQEFKKNLFFLKNDIYKDIFKKNKCQIDKKYQLVIKLLQYKMYYIVYLLSKIKKKTRKYNTGNDYFIGI